MRPEEPSLAESVRIERAGLRVGVVDEGEGPVFVGVHGLPGGVRDWRWLAPALTPAARFVRIDMPGFGKTPADTGYDIDSRGAFVADVLEALDLDDVVVLGHSMGGPVAVSAAVQSERVRAVGLIASVGPVMHQMLRRMPGLRASTYALHLPPVRAAFLPLMQRSFQKAGFRGFTDEEVLQASLIVGRVRFRTHRRNLAALRKPTLVAWAVDDRLVEEAVSEKLYWSAPIGPRIRFTTGGHNIQATRASELAEALLAWVPSLAS